MPHTPTAPPREHRQPERGPQSSSPISVTLSHLRRCSAHSRAGGKGFLFENESQLKAKRAGSGTSASRNPRKAAAPSSSRHGQQHGTAALQLPRPQGTASEAAATRCRSPQRRLLTGSRSGSFQPRRDAPGRRQRERRESRPAPAASGGPRSAAPGRDDPPHPPARGSPQPLSPLPGPIPVPIPLPAAGRPAPLPAPLLLSRRRAPSRAPRSARAVMPRVEAPRGAAQVRSAQPYGGGGAGRAEGCTAPVGAIPTRGRRSPIKSVHYQSSP